MEFEMPTPVDSQSIALNEKLKDYYLAYRELASKCVIDLAPKAPKDGSSCFYLPADSVFLNNPEAQKNYRRQFVDKMGKIGGPERLNLYGDDLHKRALTLTADYSSPKCMQKRLHDFYSLKVAELQHKKYKILLREAQLQKNPYIFEANRVVLDEVLGKIQKELDSSVERQLRLGQPDYKDSMTDDQKPIPSYLDKDGNEMLLYDVTPQKTSSSHIRLDDVEVFIRHECKDNYISRNLKKLAIHTKWLPFKERFNVFKKSRVLIDEQMGKYIKQQKEFSKALKNQKKSELGSTPNLNDIRIERIMNKYEYQEFMGSEKEYLERSYLCAYESVPTLHREATPIKVHILRMGEKYGIKGDINLDNAHSFLYKLQIIFPQIFLANTLSTEFDNYDVFTKPTDISAVLMHNFEKITPIIAKEAQTYITSKTQDPTNPHMVEDNYIDDRKYKKLFKDILPSKLKRGDWLEFVGMEGEIDDTQMRQRAILGKVEIDTTLRTNLDLLDVHDIALIQGLLLDKTYSYIQGLDNIFPGSIDHTSIGSSGCLSSTSAMKNISKKLQTQKPEEQLIKAYLQLRHLKLLEEKRNLIHRLNYFRSIQRRLALDMREYSTREKAMGDINIISNTEPNSNLKPPEQAMHSSSSMNLHKRFGQTRILDPNSLYGLHKYKKEGHFETLETSTCPILPTFHASYGNPVENVEISRFQDHFLGEKDMGEEERDEHTQEIKQLELRKDKVKVFGDKREVRIEDAFGVLVMYEPTLEDMRILEEEMLQIGSHFIQKYEQEGGLLVDRDEVIKCILQKENEYYRGKMELVEEYMCIYEHLTSPYHQYQLIQIITDTMAARPRLNLEASFPTAAYNLEIDLLRTQRDLLAQLTYASSKLELEHTEHLRETIELKRRKINDFIVGNTKYEKEESLSAGILLKSKLEGEIYIGEDQPPSKLGELGELLKLGESRGVSEKYGGTNTGTLESSIITGTLKDIGDAELECPLSDTDPYEMGREIEELDPFENILDIHPISEEQLLAQSKETDPLLQDMITEAVKFSKLEEGYGYLGSRADPGLTKLSYGGEVKHDIFTFFCSFRWILNVIDMARLGSKELQQVLIPENGMAMAAIERAFYAEVGNQWGVIQAFKDDSTRQTMNTLNQIEDELIMDHPEKLMYFMKELSSNLSEKRAEKISPYFAAKLDLESIKHHPFPQISRDQLSHPPEPENTKKISATGAGTKAASPREQTTESLNLTMTKRTHRVDEKRRNRCKHPSNLVLACNMVEVLRLREELIKSVVETNFLVDIYRKQAEITYKTVEVNIRDQIRFPKIPKGNEINFVDENIIEGSSWVLNLSFQEFDASFKEYLSMRNSETVKILFLSQGLEELRGVFHYQLMQSQLLTVGVQINQQMLDTYQRAYAEIDLLLGPNPLLTPSRYINPKSYIDADMLLKEKENFVVAMNNVTSFFYEISGPKLRYRELVTKRYNTFFSQINAQKWKHEMKTRVLRSFRLRLLHSYCKTVLREVYFDSIKIELFHHTRELRKLSYQIPPDENLWIYGIMEGYENVPAGFPPNSNVVRGFRRSPGIQKNQFILDNPTGFSLFYIPSSEELARLVTFSDHEQSEQNKALNYFTFEDDIDCQYPEQKIKELVTPPTFQKWDPTQFNFVRKYSFVNIRKPNFKEAYMYNSAAFYALNVIFILKNWYKLELFKQKLSISAKDILQMEESINSGQHFWQIITEKISAAESYIQKLGLESELANKILIEHTERKQEMGHLGEELRTLATSLKQKEELAKKTRIINKTDQECFLLYLIKTYKISYYGLLYTLDRLESNYYGKGEEEKISHIRYISKRIREQKICPIYSSLTQENIYSVLSTPTRISEKDIESIYNNCTDTDNISNIPNISPHPPNPQSIYSSITSNPLLIGNNYYYPKLLPTLERYIPPYTRRLSFPTTLYTPYSRLDVLSTALLEVNKVGRELAYTFANGVPNFTRDFLRETLYKHRGGDGGDKKGDRGNRDRDRDNRTRGLPEERGEVNLKDEVFKILFLKKIVVAKQFKEVFMMWVNQQTIPINVSKYTICYKNYMDHIFWKILKNKEELTKRKMITEQKQKSKKEEKESGDAISHIRSARELLSSQSSLTDIMQKTEKGALDFFIEAQAEIGSIKEELDMELMLTGIKIIEKEHNAIAGSFENGSDVLDVIVSPQQHFAEVLYPNIDRHANISLINRFFALQCFLTQLRNRCTHVNTLTTGPAIVFSVKDFTEGLQTLGRNLGKTTELELRTRVESSKLQERNMRHSVYMALMQVQHLQSLQTALRENINRVVTAKVIERGNQMIYDMDSLNRQIRYLKECLSVIESQMKSEVKCQFEGEISQLKIELQESKDMFKTFKETVTNTLQGHIKTGENSLLNHLKKKQLEMQADAHKSMRRSSTLFIKDSSTDEPPHGGQEDKNKRLRKGGGGEQEELTLQDKVQAFDELALTHQKLQKLRSLHLLKFQAMKAKYKSKIFNLKAELTSNAALWEELSETQKRELVIKEELVYAQQCLSTSERIITTLHDKLIEKSDEVLKLQETRNQKSKKLEELEGKIQELDFAEIIDINKLRKELIAKEKRLNELEKERTSQTSRIGALHNNYKTKMRMLETKYNTERSTKAAAFQKLGEMQMYFQERAESQGESGNELWKERCLELYELCRELQIKNEGLSHKLEGYETEKNTVMMESTPQGGTPRIIARSKEEGNNMNMNNNNEIGTITSQGLTSESNIPGTAGSGLAGNTYNIPNTQGEQRGNSSGGIGISRGVARGVTPGLTSKRMDYYFNSLGKGSGGKGYNNYNNYSNNPQISQNTTYTTGYTHKPTTGYTMTTGDGGVSSSRGTSRGVGLTFSGVSSKPATRLRSGTRVLGRRGGSREKGRGGAGGGGMTATGTGGGGSRGLAKLLGLQRPMTQFAKENPRHHIIHGNINISAHNINLLPGTFD